MGDFTSIIETMKKAAIDAVDATKPMNVIFGKVISASPLKINVEQKMTLEAQSLILTRNVTDHTIQMSVNHFTDDEYGHIHAVQDTYTGGGTSTPTTHKHAYTGRKSYVVHNGLTVGDNVILIRQQDGQKFVIIDRLG